MSYTVEKINDCTRRINFEFQDVDLSTQIEQALKLKQRDANLKGFRKGKAPISVVKQVYGSQVEQEALYRFVSQEFYKAVQEEDIKAVGQPAFSNTNLDTKAISFDATVEVFPEIELKDYSDYSFKKQDTEVTDKDVEEFKTNLLNSKAQMVEVKDENVTIENGHHVVFNFEGEKEDGSRPDNMQAKEFLLEIGSGQFIPGFEEGMIGLKKGAKETIDVSFPSDYHEEGLRDAKVKFHVEVLEIKEQKLPEFTDELAKEVGFDSAEDFEKKTRARLEAQKKREAQAKLQEQILNKLIEDNKFDVPSALVEAQKKSVVQELGQNLKAQGFDDNMLGTYFDKWANDVEEKAVFQVRSGLILDKLANEFDIEVSDEDFDKKIEEIAKSSNMEADKLAGYYKENESVKNNLKYALREEKTFEKIIEKIQVA